MKHAAELIRVFFAIPIALLAGSLYGFSCLQQIWPSLGSYLPTFFTAMAVGSTGGMLNILARTFDHCGKPTKTWNQVAGIFSIGISLTQIAIGIGTAKGMISSMPIAISPGLSTASMFLAEGLHWQRKPTFRASYQHNKGRYIGFFVGILSMTCSILSWKMSSNTIYFLASAFFDAFVLAGLSNRKYDIDTQADRVNSDPEEDNAYNKKMISRYAMLIAVTFGLNLIFSGLKFFADTHFNPPVAFPNFMMLTSLPLYLIAQAKLSLLSPMHALAKEKIANTCSAVGGCFRSCWNGLSNTLSNCTQSLRNACSNILSFCRRRSPVEPPVPIPSVVTSSQDIFVNVHAEEPLLFSHDDLPSWQPPVVSADFSRLLGSQKSYGSTQNASAATVVSVDNAQGPLSAQARRFEL